MPAVQIVGITGEQSAATSATRSGSGRNDASGSEKTERGRSPRSSAAGRVSGAPRSCYSAPGGRWPRRADYGPLPRQCSRRHPIPVAENFVILFVIAALAGGCALVLFTTMWRVERRAQSGREAGIKRSQRLERRVFLIGVALVVAMVTVVVTVQLSRAPGCHGTLVMV